MTSSRWNYAAAVLGLACGVVDLVVLRAPGLAAFCFFSSVFQVLVGQAKDRQVKP